MKNLVEFLNETRTVFTYTVGVDERGNPITLSMFDKNEDIPFDADVMDRLFEKYGDYKDVRFIKDVFSKFKKAVSLKVYVLLPDGTSRKESFVDRRDMENGWKEM
jgi:hypothetical protein